MHEYNVIHLCIRTYAIIAAIAAITARAVALHRGPKRRSDHRV